MFFKEFTNTEPTTGVSQTFMPYLLYIIQRQLIQNQSL